ncbi:RNA pyrophosphohydrolase [Segnochrobactraceae bacterium EtOH-i3]
MSKKKSAADLPYRPCVGIALFNREGKVFVGQRANAAASVGDAHLWQMPQGGIDKGEDPRDAALRELYEETSVKSATIVSEAPEWFLYDLPTELVGVAWKGRYRGQTQKWFALRFDGDESEIDVLHPPKSDEVEFVTWRWETLEALPDLVVPFKRPVYEQVVAAFRHLVP